ncbi:anaerobic magnesium-protoporphyrin IX monomethyl ester cyclase [Thermoflexales bacterium]|nr:anaerobic magnesium-protoporphyrin IX monomethyl ester cyclase [Thermoflexales bacterium]
MLDILLVLPPPVISSPIDPPKGIAPPLGLGYLAAVLEQAGYQVALLDMQAEHVRGADLTQFVREQQPRVVGISTVVKTYKNGLRAAQLIKNVAPATKVIVGGPQATFLVDETLACPAVDVVVRFEGEETMLELMHHFADHGPALDRIRGIAFRDGDRICQTDPRPLIADLDSLPWPARRLFKLEQYAEPGILITARGCSSQCVFCAANTLYPDPPYRARSPRLVVDEIEELVKRYRLNSFFIADDTFTLWPKRAIDICELLIARGLKVNWTCEARINTMTAHLAEKLVEAGCTGVNYGVETGNPEIMRQIRKGIRLARVEDVVNLSQARGLDVVCSFIIGLPQDTFKTVGQTIELSRRLEKLGTPSTRERQGSRGRVTCSFTILTPLPGTHVYEHAQELGIRFLTKDWDHYTLVEPVIETQHLQASDLHNLYFEATLGPRSTLFATTEKDAADLPANDSRRLQGNLSGVRP